jgi:hypothetical protein
MPSNPQATRPPLQFSDPQTAPPFHLAEGSLTRRRPKLLWRSGSCWIHCHACAFLNHGYKTKIQHTKENSAREDKIGIKDAHGSFREENENAALRLLLR